MCPSFPISFYAPGSVSSEGDDADTETAPGSRRALLLYGVLAKLLVDLDDDAGTNGTAAFTDSEAEALLDSDRG